MRDPRNASKVVKHWTLEDEYELTSTVLGEGMSGQVRMAKRRACGTKVAIKTLEILKTLPEAREYIQNELSVHIRMDHPNIAKLYEIYEEETSGKIHMVMEYLSGGELFEWIQVEEKSKS